MLKIRGRISKNGIVTAENVDLNFNTQESGGKRTTACAFTLPSNIKMEYNPIDPSFEVELQDGRIGILYIDKRHSDGANQHFLCRVLGLQV